MRNSAGDEWAAMIARMIRAWAAGDLRVMIEVMAKAGHLANHDNPVASN